MEDVIKRMAKEIAPQLDALYGDQAEYFEDPEQMDAIVRVFWDNKMGILRVLQAVAKQERFTAEADTHGTWVVYDNGPIHRPYRSRWSTERDAREEAARLNSAS